MSEDFNYYITDGVNVYPDNSNDLNDADFLQVEPTRVDIEEVDHGTLSLHTC
jgi:hypothetical protein